MRWKRRRKATHEQAHDITLQSDEAFTVELRDPTGRTEATLIAHASEIDDALVVQIETNEGTGRLRVYVNDGAVFDADPERGDHRDTVAAYAAELVETLDHIAL